MTRESGEDMPLAPEATPVPDANRTRLEALLRELLRDQSLRELLSTDKEFTSQSHGGT